LPDVSLLIGGWSLVDLSSSSLHELYESIATAMHAANIVLFLISFVFICFVSYA
jgi:MFS-type transporter involved in bile tolerance (Atg22 family)